MLAYEVFEVIIQVYLAFEIIIQVYLAFEIIIQVYLVFEIRQFNIKTVHISILSI